MDKSRSPEKVQERSNRARQPGYTAPPMSETARDFGRDVQSALAVLYDTIALQTHPLVRHVQSARKRALSPVSAGRLLRQALLEMIASLRPAGRAAMDRAVGDRDGRAHLLLELRYVDGLDPEAIQQRLGISKSLYYLEHKRALSAAIASLAERWGTSAADATQEGDERRGIAPKPSRVGSAPRPPTSFVGRARELDQIDRLLGLSEPLPTAAGARELPVRLVTLLGPAGAGKTRLATETAARAAARAQRVCFVELASFEDSALVLPAIAAAAGGHVAAEPAALREALAGFDLLVLDNFEQVIDAAGAIATLVEGGGPRVLVTSRAPLQVYGEWELSVEPLPLPAAGDGVAASDAVRLFIERARAVRPDFALTAENSQAIAAIVQRLDGLPLAIELAAARTRVLPPHELLLRLDHRLAVLSAGPRELPSRQRTLEGALDWSYRLLDDAERLAFRRLAVLAGGGTLNAASTLSGAPLERLESLVSKSLLRQDTQSDGTSRLSMLETVREFAWDRLASSGEIEDVQREHAAYYLALAEAAEPHLAGPTQGEWLHRLERDYPNLRAAVRWFAANGQANSGLRLASALRQFWLMHGHWAEGREWLSDLLALAPEDRSPVRAKALDRAGVLASAQGDPRLARAFYEQALALWRELGDERGAARSLTGLANAAVAEGELARGRALYEDAIAHLREGGDDQGLANALGQLGISHYLEGENDAAERLFDESLAVRQVIGDRAGLVHAMNMLGCVARCTGHYARADAYYRDCLDLCDQVGHRLGTATVLYNLAQMALAKHEPASIAADLLLDSLTLFQQLDDRRGLGICLESVAIASAETLPNIAIRLFAAAEKLFEQTRMRRPPADIELSRTALAAAHHHLGEGRARAAWTAGKGLLLDEAIKTALGAAASLAAAPQHVDRPRNDQSQYASNIS